MKIYAGIGSRRRTPINILDLMTAVASKLEDRGYVLRSGGAIGADKAFEDGVRYPEGKVIYKYKHATPESIKFAARFHPYWDSCDELSRRYHGRNAMIIMGPELNTPVKFVLCYTPDGKPSGGTGVGISIAEAYKIPVFNLFYIPVRTRLINFVDYKEETLIL